MQTAMVLKQYFGVDKFQFRTDINLEVRKNKKRQYYQKISNADAFLLQIVWVYITDCGKLSTVQDYIRELQRMGINPVTISRRDESVMKKITPTKKLYNMA